MKWGGLPVYHVTETFAFFKRFAPHVFELHLLFLDLNSHRPDL